LPKFENSAPPLLKERGFEDSDHRIDDGVRLKQNKIFLSIPKQNHEKVFFIEHLLDICLWQITGSEYYPEAG
jgi:hypothetical protein